MRLNRTYTPLIFAGTVILLYLPVFPGWAKDVFTNENNQHCIVIPFISLYIAFQKKNILMKLSAASSGQKGALWLYVLGLMVYVIGVGGGIVFFQQLSLVVLIAGTVLFLYGRDIFCALMFPLFYLVFAIPIPEAAYQAFSSPLKQCASMISAHLIRLFDTGVPRRGESLFSLYEHRSGGCLQRHALPRFTARGRHRFCVSLSETHLPQDPACAQHRSDRHLFQRDAHNADGHHRAYFRFEIRPRDPAYRAGDGHRYRTRRGAHSAF